MLQNSKFWVKKRKVEAKKMDFKAFYAFICVFQYSGQFKVAK